jgi:hypothetical protein
MLMSVIILALPTARKVVRVYPSHTKKPPPRA